MSVRDRLRKPPPAAPNPALGPVTNSPEESAPPPPIRTLPHFSVGDRIADTYAMEATLYYLLMGQYSYNFPAPAEIQAFQQQNRKLWDRPEEAYDYNETITAPRMGPCLFRGKSESEKLRTM